MNHLLTFGNLTVKIFESRRDMGSYAALDIADGIRETLARKAECNMIFAAAPSQNETLEALCSAPVDWTRVNAFHMDEYIGLPENAPQRFGNFLKNALFGKLPFKSVSYIDGGAPDISAECARYAGLLAAYPTDIVVMGIGENGHIAFNDPHAARFDDPEVVKTVDLDETCRMQQVHDKCFASLDLVPRQALTLTIPTLARAPRHYCVVPGAAKAAAVRRTLLEPVSEKCPAGILRRCPDSILYLDADSSAAL